MSAIDEDDTFSSVDNEALSEFGASEGESNAGSFLSTERSLIVNSGRSSEYSKKYKVVVFS